MSIDVAPPCNGDVELAKLAVRSALHQRNQDCPAAILDAVRAGCIPVPDATVAVRSWRHPPSDSSPRAKGARPFDEERRWFRGDASAFADLGWIKAKRHQWHLSARFGALSRTPAVLRPGAARQPLPKLARHTST